METHEKYVNIDKLIALIQEQKDFLFTPEDMYQLLRDERYLHGFNLVHCEDCKFYSATNWIDAKLHEQMCDCKINVIEFPNPDDYCSLGVFRNDENGNN